jgi:hypothetical protein
MALRLPPGATKGSQVTLEALAITSIAESAAAMLGRMKTSPMTPPTRQAARAARKLRRIHQRRTPGRPRSGRKERRATRYPGAARKASKVGETSSRAVPSRDPPMAPYVIGAAIPTARAGHRTP